MVDADVTVPVARLMHDPLPWFAHAPPDPGLTVAPWVVPRDPAPRGADVIVIGELAHQLMTRCERDDPLYIEVWVGRRLDPGRPWPTSVPA